jgi:hypothetical protein
MPFDFINIVKTGRASRNKAASMKLFKSIAGLALAWLVVENGDECHALKSSSAVVSIVIDLINQAQARF